MTLEIYSMKPGIKRFDHFLEQLQIQLNKSSKQKNPGLWLYQNDARTTLFMLEGLSKLYTGLHDHKIFSKLDAEFKELEDILGAIDYYDCFAREFAKNKRIPSTVSAYLEAQSREKIQNLNEVLKEKKWLSDGNIRMNKILKKLKKINWLKEKKETNRICECYKDSINIINIFIGKTNFHFENVEADVHELRRKLRWLSIYPHALRGCIQLSKLQAPPKFLDKYLTPEITGSPFNRMPDAGSCKQFLLLEKNYFYSLSWMIAELGILKDSGLRVIAVKEALQQTTGINETAAYKQAYTLLGPKQPSIKQVLDRADALCKNYFQEKCLEHLVIGTAAVK